MIKINDRKLLGKIIAESLVKINSDTNLNTAEKFRWVNALAKAVVLIEEQPEWITYHADLNMVTIWNQKTLNTYNANGQCECYAFLAGQPCKHRCVKQLVKLYLEAEKPLPTSNQFRDALAAAQKAEQNTALYSKVVFHKSEKVEGFRI